MTLYDKIIWLLMAAIGLGLLIAYRAVGTELPPMPEAKKVYRPAKGVTQGAGAANLTIPEVVVPPITNLWLAWNWTADTNNPASNVVFLVREGRGNSLTPSKLWPVIVTTTQHLASVRIDRTIKAAWFSVTASNVVTLEESGFAIR